MIEWRRQLGCRLRPPSDRPGNGDCDGGMAAHAIAETAYVRARCTRSMTPPSTSSFAARALGLDVGQLSGFDNAKLDEEFFAAGKECKECDQERFPEGHMCSNFLCDFGYGDPSKLRPRLQRLDFDEACTIM